MASRTSTARQIEAEIRAAIETQDAATIDEANEQLANEVKAFIQSKTPIDTGDAVGSIQVRKVKKPRNGLPARTIFSDSPMFHMVEYGTKADPDDTQEPRRVEIDGKWVTLGRDTPTQAAAPFGQAKAKYGL